WTRKAEPNLARIEVPGGTNAYDVGWVISGARETTSRAVLVQRIRSGRSEPILRLEIGKVTSRHQEVKRSNRLAPAALPSSQIAFGLEANIDVFVPDGANGVITPRQLPFWWLDKNLAHDNLLASIGGHWWNPVRELRFDLSEKA